MKTSMTLVQAKLTSLYGNGSKDDNKSFMGEKISEDCVVIEKDYSSHNYRRYTKPEEEEGARGISFKTKRLHKETSSPRNDNMKSPSGGEEAEVETSSSGFVTARAKLVCASLCHEDALDSRANT